MRNAIGETITTNFVVTVFALQKRIATDDALRHTKEVKNGLVIKIG